jgi:hypothetical protein
VIEHRFPLIPGKDSGALKVSVTAEFDLERAPEAFAAFGAGTVGKTGTTVA